MKIIFFRKNSKSYEEAMKDARTRKASNYFDKENQGIKEGIDESENGSNRDWLESRFYELL